jgi:hypothetical protein
LHYVTVAQSGEVKRGSAMRIAAFGDKRLGVVGSDNTIVDITDVLQQYEPLGPEDMLPDLRT